MKKLSIKMICDNCKKEAKETDIDKKQSNDNWKVYKKCECGGTFMPKV